MRSFVFPITVFSLCRIWKFRSLAAPHYSQSKTKRGRENPLIIWAVRVWLLQYWLQLYDLMVKTSTGRQPDDRGCKILWAMWLFIVMRIMLKFHRYEIKVHILRFKIVVGNKLNDGKEKETLHLLEIFQRWICCNDFHRKESFLFGDELRLFRALWYQSLTVPHHVQFTSE